MTDQQLIVHECSHLRPVVSLDGEWRHVNYYGQVTGSVCEAGTFRYVAERPPDAHTVGHSTLSEFVGGSESGDPDIATRPRHSSTGTGGER